MIGAHTVIRHVVLHLVCAHTLVGGSGGCNLAPYCYRRHIIPANHHCRAATSQHQRWRLLRAHGGCARRPVQDSTVLWEALPQDVMDAAIREHHAVIRRLLLRHGGYESATEGDSFILAFHTAHDAVLFSSQLQQELLTAPWPPDLLSTQLCEPAYAAFSRCVPATCKHAM
jgi:hypothetical protein